MVSTLAVDGTLNEKVPSALVVVPFVVPFTTTEALATG